MSYASIEIGCSGWIRTSTVPLNRRTDYCYPTEQLKMVTAAGLAPAVTWSQARHVAATLRGVAPAYWERKPGAFFLCGDEAWQLPGAAAASEIGALDGTCTHTLPADNGLLFYSATRAFFSAKCRVESAELGTMKHRNLQLRTKQFALQIIKFCESLPKNETSRMLARQLLRSGTSVGANYRAVCRSKSKPARTKPTQR